MGKNGQIDGLAMDSATLLSNPDLICHSVHLHLILDDDRANGGVVVLRQVLVLFQQMLDPFLHGGAGDGFLLTVNGAFVEHLDEFSGGFLYSLFRNKMNQSFLCFFQYRMIPFRQCCYGLLHRKPPITTDFTDLYLRLLCTLRKE